MARVFISHAGVDRSWALEVREWLTSGGHEVFLDLDPVEGLAVGEEWERRLYERLRWADAVVCVVTPAYLRSVWCAAEIGIARATGSRLLPIRFVAGVTHPLLKSIQQADAAADPAVAREKLARSLRTIDVGGGLGWPDGRSPYPGLAPFDTDMHRVFFGRATEAAELTELLRQAATRSARSIVLVIGPSGAGKSSLVRAGIIPLIADEPYWLPLEPVIPGTDPVGALARALVVAGRGAGMDWLVESMRERLATDGLRDVAADILIATDSPPQRKLLLVIDQFEEVLGPAVAAQRTRFAELLAPAIGGPVQVLATVRTEFLDQIMVDPALAALGTRTFPVRPLRVADLREVIEGPARVAGLRIDEGLVEELLADTDSGEALPLLAFALAQLADGVQRNGVLSRRRYRETGGVRGALVRQAELALDEACAATGLSDDEVVATLLRLVTVDEQGVPTRERVPRAELSETAVAVVDAFVAHRLVTTDTAGSRIVVSVSHEAFLRNWSRLAAAVGKETTALRARRAVELAAAEWDADRRSANRLWERGRLAAAMHDTGARLRRLSRPRWRVWPPRLRALVTERIEISSRATEFLELSYRRDRLRRGRATALLSILLVAALVGAGVAVVKQRAAVEQQHTAVARQLMAQADKLIGVDPRTALRLGLAANSIHPSDETRHWLVNGLSTTRYTGTLDGPVKRVMRAVFAPNGRLLAAQHEDGTIVLWDLADPAGPHRVGEPLRGVSTLATPIFSPDSRTLLSGAGIDTDDRASGNGVAPVGHNIDWSSLHGVLAWDLADPQHPRVSGTVLPNIGEKTTLIFGPDTSIGVTAGTGQPTQLWDFSDRSQPRPIETLLPVDAEKAVAFSADGRTLAVGTTQDVTLWDVSDHRQPRRIGQYSVQVRGVLEELAFSPDGRTLAADLFYAGILLWDITDPQQPRRLGKPILDSDWGSDEIAFAKEGHVLATAPAVRNQVYLYDLTDPASPVRIAGPLIGQPAAVTTLTFSTGGRFATGTDDGRTTLWTTDIRAQPQMPGPPLAGSMDKIAGPCGVATDGSVVAIAGTNGNVDLWDIAGGGDPVETATWNTEHVDFMNDIRISCLALSPDGKTLATGSPDRTVSLWDIRNRRHPRRWGPPLTGMDGIVRAIAFAPTGDRLAIGSDQNSLEWDIYDPAAPKRLGRGLYGQQVQTLAFTTGGRLFAFAHQREQITIWNMTDSNRPARVGTLSAGAEARVAYSAAADLLVTAAEDSTGQLWDVRDPSHPRAIGDPLRPGIDTFTAVFDAKGGMLAALGLDGRIVVWDITDPSHVTRIGEPVGGLEDAVSAAQFTGDGGRLVAGYVRGAAIVWDLTAMNELRGRPAEFGCATVGSGLDRSEWNRYIQQIPYRSTC
ncbi:hypothetical protein B7C42_08160 [Nocardia cerradoensis]|uniref:TIR domain-containing protein n=1 Tax=Nocardia cerradoensis TaxID=85688 RepID=A0A231GT17_9NOCA|nr:TIR domain-containing protein [Nocardia cerradoensis]OXR39766.1 hypothetical protein B7C42_08160 [Nocardia cerradoensis]